MRIGPIALIVCLGALAWAQAPATSPAPRVYPGARIDTVETAVARTAAAANPQLDVTVYTTADPFDKVYAYFQKNGREFKTIGSRARKLPNGQELRDAFFILDGAESLPSSRRWVKVQRPYLGQYGLARGGKQPEIRDVTAIVLTLKK